MQQIWQIASLILVLVGIGQSAMAQVPDFSAAALTSEDVVRVDHGSGVSTVGRFRSFASGELTLDVRGRRVAIPEENIVRLERRQKDSVWNGVLIGLGIGGAIGGLGLYASRDSDAIYSMMGLAPAAIAAGAILGWVVDRNHHSWSPVSAKSRSTLVFAPAIGRRTAGINGSLSW